MTTEAEYLAEYEAVMASAPVNGDERAPPSLARDFAEWARSAPTHVPVIWGDKERAVWVEGQSFMLVGSPGVGKTTITQQLLLGLAGVCETVLGLPIKEVRRTLYLAVDRPQQAQQAAKRIVTEDNFARLKGRILVWPGPTPHDLAKRPAMLVELLEQHDADVVLVGSLKDIALGLSDPALDPIISSAINLVVSSGKNIMLDHHPVKRGGITLDDVYGGRMLGASAGSVVMLNKTDDGDVSWHHVKSAIEPVEFGHIELDLVTGEVRVKHEFDLRGWLEAAGKPVTTRDVAQAMKGDDDVTEADINKARHRMGRIEANGLVERVDTGKRKSVAWVWIEK